MLEHQAGAVPLLEGVEAHHQEGEELYHTFPVPRIPVSQQQEEPYEPKTDEKNNSV